MSKGRGSRVLDPADRALWSEITKSIKPLRKTLPQTASVEPAPSEEGEAQRKADPTLAPKQSKAAANPPPPLARFDRRARNRVSRGRIEIDGRLDLHGLTLERARSRLSLFLASSQSRGATLVLVITGKSGAMRREAPHWLSLPELRSLIVGFEEAAPAHGGTGALYVRIRRARS
jgi:DNA-nicking Smr family endonuclease